MTDLNKRIDELEKLAAESDLIAQLAVDPKARCANATLANELRQLATTTSRSSGTCAAISLMTKGSAQLKSQ